MTDAAIIQATFSEWRMIKGRKVLQIICEVPLEQQGVVFSALGTPLPDNEPWVAIARLREPVAHVVSDPEQPQIAAPEQDTPKPPARLSQIAGIICGEGAFATYMRDVHGYGCEPAEAVRLYCGVDSRRELDDEANTSARSNFTHLKSAYEAWLRCDDLPSVDPETLGRQGRAA